jgi:lipoprotein Spr
MKQLGLLVLTVFLISAAEAQSHLPLERPGKNEAPRFIESIELSSERNLPAVINPEELYPTPSSTPIPANTYVNGSMAQQDIDRLLNPLSIEQCDALQFKYALLTDQEVESIRNIELYRFVDEWWGTRYRYGGDDRSGIDCSAFTAKLNKEVFGLELPRTAREQYKMILRIPDFELQEGDLVFFNTTGGVSHVGVYLGNQKFVHASSSGGVLISDLNDKYYHARFLGAGRLTK